MLPHWFKSSTGKKLHYCILTSLTWNWMQILLYWSRNSFTILSKSVTGFRFKGAAQKNTKQLIRTKYIQWNMIRLIRTEIVWKSIKINCTTKVCARHYLNRTHRQNEFESWWHVYTMNWGVGETSRGIQIHLLHGEIWKATLNV